MIPRATNICHLLQEKPFVEPIVKRESHSFDPHRLATAAHQQGMLHQKLSCAIAVENITE